MFFCLILQRPFFIQRHKPMLSSDYQNAPKPSCLLSSSVPSESPRIPQDVNDSCIQSIIDFQSGLWVYPSNRLSSSGLYHIVIAKPPAREAEAESQANVDILVFFVFKGARCLFCMRINIDESDHWRPNVTVCPNLR
ncbi:DNA-binding protein HEXBP [Fusarium oxysporum f. sp. albedinis]|nr:DNA-binding protein HEXBP [Fusarium oxysporum f. sp. albedinis]